MKGVTLTNASAQDRNPYDFYRTPWEVTQALVDALQLTGKTIWEPACGDGDMASVLSENGNDVIATELRETNYGESGVDFLSSGLQHCDWIITNPPFNLAVQFIERCIEFERPFAMLLKSQYWHSKGRLSLFQKHTPSHVLPLTWRPDFHFGAKGGSPTMECAWTVWDKVPSNVTQYIPLVKPAARPALAQGGEDE